jgi:hypothetical protein
VEMCGRRVSKKRDYFALPSTTYSECQWKKIMHHLSVYNPKVLFHVFNKGLRVTVMIGANDEAI